MAILRRKVNWVLDADIRGFFDTLDHGWLVKFIEHRVADRACAVDPEVAQGRGAGGCKRIESEVGTVQGGSISPLLPTSTCTMCSILGTQWRRAKPKGCGVVSLRMTSLWFRAQRGWGAVLSELRKGFLVLVELHAKDRLIEFGRQRKKTAEPREGKPETFTSWIHAHCAKTRKGSLRCLDRRCARGQAKLRESRRVRRVCTSPCPRWTYVRAVLVGQCITTLCR